MRLTGVPAKREVLSDHLCLAAGGVGLCTARWRTIATLKMQLRLEVGRWMLSGEEWAG